MGVTVDVKTERNVCGIVRSEVEAAGNGHARVGKIHAGNRNPFLIGQRGAVEKKAWESAPIPTRQGERGGGIGIGLEQDRSGWENRHLTV